MAYLCLVRSHERAAILSTMPGLRASLHSLEHLACQHLLTHSVPEVRRQPDSPTRFAVFPGLFRHSLHLRNFTFVALVAAGICRLWAPSDDLRRMAHRCADCPAGAGRAVARMVAWIWDSGFNDASRPDISGIDVHLLFTGTLLFYLFMRPNHAMERTADRCALNF